MVGLMRYQPRHLLGGGGGTSGSRARAQLGPAALPMPVVAMLCIVVGFLLGAQQRGREPYPLEASAFLPPPERAQDPPHHFSHHQLQHRQTRPPPAVSSAAAAVAAPAANSGTRDAGGSILAGSPLPQMEQFAEQFLQQSGLLKLRPPVAPGRSGDNFYTVVPHQVLSWYPRVVLFPGFLDEATAQHIIRLAEPRLEPSTLGVGSVPVPEQPAGPDEPEVRTSEGVFLDRSHDPDGVLAWVEEKIAAVTFIPPSHGEEFNVLRYRNGQHYHSHMDTFDGAFLRRVDPGFGQRMATVILYLSDVEEGGETVFKREGRYGAASASEDDDLTTCEEHDFKYKPRVGDAVLFFSMNPDLSINPRALHGACPVKGGSIKWVATKWLHDKPITDWDGEAQG